jgi:hypothetical protein
MSHHGNDQERELAAHMKRVFGEFPNGRLNENDAGAMAVAIGVENGVVIMNFGHSLKWIGFTPDQAIDLAEILIKHARKCGSKNWRGLAEKPA